MSDYDRLRECAKYCSKSYLKEDIIVCFLLSLIPITLSSFFWGFNTKSVVISCGVFSISFVLFYTRQKLKKDRLMKDVKSIIEGMYCNKYDIISVIQDVKLDSENQRYDFSCKVFGHEKIIYKGFVSYADDSFCLDLPDNFEDFEESLKYASIRERIEGLFSGFTGAVSNSGREFFVTGLLLSLSAIIFISENYFYFLFLIPGLLITAIFSDRVEDKIKADVINKILKMKYDEEFSVSNVRRDISESDKSSFCYSFSFSDKDGNDYFGKIFPSRRVIDDDYSGEISDGFLIGNTQIVNGEAVSVDGMQEVFADDSFYDFVSKTEQDAEYNEDFDEDFDENKEQAAALYEKLQGEFHRYTINEQSGLNAGAVIIFLIAFYPIYTIISVFAYFSIEGFSLSFGGPPSHTDDIFILLWIFFPFVSVFAVSVLLDNRKSKIRKRLEPDSMKLIEELLFLSYNKFFAVRTIDSLFVDKVLSGYKFSFSDEEGEYEGKVFVLDKVLRTNYKRRKK